MNTPAFVDKLLASAKSAAERRGIIRKLHRELLRAARKEGDMLPEMPAADRPMPPNMSYDADKQRYIYRIQEGGQKYKKVLGSTRAEADVEWGIVNGQIAAARQAKQPIATITAFSMAEHDDNITFVGACEHAGIMFSNRRGGVNPRIMAHFGDMNLRDIGENTVKQFILVLLKDNCSDAYIEKNLWSLNKILRRITRGRNIANVMRMMLDDLEPRQKPRSWWRPADSPKQLDLLRAAAASRKPNSKSRKTAKGELNLEGIQHMIAKAKEYGDTDKYGRHRFSNFYRHCLFGDELVLFCWILLYTAQRFTAVRCLTFTSTTTGNYVDFAKNIIVLHDNKTGTVAIAMNGTLREMLRARYNQQQEKHAGEKVVPVFDTLPVGVSKLMRRFFDYCGFKNLEPYGTIKGTVVSKVIALSGGRAKTAAAAIGVTPQVLQKHYERIDPSNPLMLLDYSCPHVVPRGGRGKHKTRSKKGMPQ